MRVPGVRWSRHGAEGLGGGRVVPQVRSSLREGRRGGEASRALVRPDAHSGEGRALLRRERRGPPQDVPAAGPVLPATGYRRELPGEPVRPVRVSTQNGEPVATVP